MQGESQINGRRIVLLAILCMLPSLREAQAVIWGNAHGMTGKALRDGLDFWAGGALAWRGQAALLFDPVAYNAFLTGIYGKLPFHLWSYPPNYLLIASAFGWLRPWPAVLAFDAASLLALVAVLRLARQPWALILAVALSPASLENLLEGQNAALMTALIGGGLLLLSSRPRLGGALIGLASIKPQLGIVLPVYLLRRAPAGFLYAVCAAIILAAAALLVLGPGSFAGFWHVTRPAMSAVLTTGKPADFYGGLISVFAVARPLGLHAAFIIQGAVTLGCVILAARQKTAIPVLILAALASPYLHVYDLLGVTLAVALLVRDRLQSGFHSFEAVLLMIAWAGPGLLPWAPGFAHLTPALLLLVLATACRRGRFAPCDSSQVPPVLPALSAGPSPIPARPGSMAPGLSVTE